MYKSEDMLKAAVATYGTDGALLLADSAVANTAGLGAEVDDLGAQVDVRVDGDFTAEVGPAEDEATRLLKAAVAGYGDGGRLRLAKSTMQSLVGSRLVADSYSATQTRLRVVSDDARVI